MTKESILNVSWISEKNAPLMQAGVMKEPLLSRSWTSENNTVLIIIRVMKTVLQK